MNWGIPKELADFTCEKKGSSTDRIRILKDDTTAAEFTVRPYPLRIPVTTGLVPRSWRTLAHIHEGKAAKGPRRVLAPRTRLEEGVEAPVLLLAETA